MITTENMEFNKLLCYLYMLNIDFPFDKFSYKKVSNEYNSLTFVNYFDHTI